MISDIDVIVEGFIKHNLSPTKSEQDLISEKYNELKKILTERTFQNGSYARHTSITPVNDLDVFYVLPHDEELIKAAAEARIDPYELNIDDILNSFAMALLDAYQNVARVVVQAHSVGIYFGSDDEFSIDVVPAIETNNGLYLVPDTSLFSVSKRRELYKSMRELRWIKSDPKGYIKQATDVDTKSKGRFRKVAKLVKKWKVAQKKVNSRFPLKSFHLEMVVTEYYKKSIHTSSFSAVEQVFNSLDRMTAKPMIADLADENTYVDDYLNELDSEQKKLAEQGRQEAIKIIGQIKTASTRAEVINGLNLLLGIGSSEYPNDRAIIGTASTKSAYSKPYFGE